MFAILQYLVKLVIKPRNFSFVSRQPALTWQAVCTQIVVRGIKLYHPSMKRTSPLNTALWHILAVYIMCQCDLDLLSISPKIGLRDPEGVVNICVDLEVHRPLHF